MISRAPTNTKRIFISASHIDISLLKQTIADLGFEAVSVDDLVVPGLTWLDSVQRSIQDADAVLGVMEDPRQNPNLLFELGIATAFKKPITIFITGTSPIDRLPIAGIPHFRIDLRDKSALTFCLKQALSLSPRDQYRETTRVANTRPIGSPLADELLHQLQTSDGKKFEDIVYAAITASSPSTLIRGGDMIRNNDPNFMGVDFAIWMNELEPNVGNPLLIECKYRLDIDDFEKVFGRLFLSLRSIPNGFGVVIYKDSWNLEISRQKYPPIVFISVYEFLNKLRNTSLADYAKNLRNIAYHGG